MCCSDTFLSVSSHTLVSILVHKKGARAARPAQQARHSSDNAVEKNPTNAQLREVPTDLRFALEASDEVGSVLPSKHRILARNLLIPSPPLAEEEDESDSHFHQRNRHIHKKMRLQRWCARRYCQQMARVAVVG